ncbi:flagellar hook-length control protein FliK [Serpens gallinarum]
MSINLAGPVQQANSAILPAAAESASAAVVGTASQDVANNAPEFATELHASAELLPELVDVPAELEPVESGAVEPTLVAPEGEAGLEQIEALLGSLLAQQQQQVQAQPATSQSAVLADRAAQSLPGLPGDRLTQPHIVDGKAPVLPAPVEVRSETLAGAARAEAAPLNTGNAIGTTVDMAGGKAAEGETSAVLSGQASQLPAAVSALPERTLKLQGSDAQRGEQMLHALRDSVDMQIQQKAQRATIRLDPPELGKLEIVVSQEVGRITIQINAGQADTLRLLQQTSDRLRQELLTQHFVQVNVQVGADSQSGQQSRQEPLRYAENAVRDNVLEPSGDDTRQRDTSDVLVTV